MLAKIDRHTPDSRSGNEPHAATLFQPINPMGDPFALVGEGMRRLVAPILSLIAGCCAHYEDVSHEIEAQVAAVAAARAAPEAVPSPSSQVLPAGPINLAVLWNLALANNPSLREAAADSVAAQGHLLQAGKFPNPRLSYTQEELGTQQNAAGSVVVQVSQEFVTAGKRRLDVALATREVDAATVALLGRKFEVLSKVRRAYYDVVALAYTVRVNEEALASLQQAVEITRTQVEQTKNRPRTDLLRVQALYKEAQINRDKGRAALEAAWRQLAAEIGLPELPRPTSVGDLPDALPQWDVSKVQARALAANTELKRAAVDADHARLALERARAEAIPNVTLGGGFSRNFAENERGGVVSVETTLPLWDRKQGRILEAQAHLARAQAAEQTVAARLARETAEAFGRFQAARRQVQALRSEVLPPLVESLDLLRKGYQAGAAQITFADVLSAEQALLTTGLTLAEARRNLWLAITDLEGLMQLDVGEELPEPAPR
jgi:cobalt-zinc-cadmium efflux system outer membrane protein